MDSTKKKQQLRLQRKKRIRAKVHGTKKRPRLVVFRSNTRLYAQLVDDQSHQTIFTHIENGKNIEAAKVLGARVAEDAKKRKITTVVFDRNGYKYHGRLKALADAAREGGLKF